MCSLRKEDVALTLIKTNCLQIATYGLDACPVNYTDIHSYEFMMTRTLMRIFKTSSVNVVNVCREMFGIKSMREMINIAKERFLQRYRHCENVICDILSNYV